MGNLDLRHLRVAVAAAEQGSFRQTAEQLGIQQSTVSRSVREFEHLLGVKIFERSSGGIVPTQIGKRILRSIEAVLEELEGIVGVGGSDCGTQVHRLAVGFYTSLSAGNLRATLLEFRGKRPEVCLVAVEKSRLRLARMLRSGSLDIVVAAEHACLLDCKSLPIWSERVLAALPRDHNLADRDVLYWTDLKDQTVLLSRCDPSPELETILRSKLGLPVDRLRIEKHNVSRGELKALVSMRMGIGLILESDLSTHPSAPLYRELRDGTGPSRIDFAAFWRSDNENPALAAFVKLLHERYPSPCSEA